MVSSGFPVFGMRGQEGARMTGWMDGWVEECLDDSSICSMVCVWQRGMRKGGREEREIEKGWSNRGWMNTVEDEWVNQRLMHLSFRANTHIYICVCVTVLSGLYVLHVSILSANSNRRYVTSVNRNWADPLWLTALACNWPGISDTGPEIKQVK